MGRVDSEPAVIASSLISYRIDSERAIITSSLMECAEKVQPEAGYLGGAQEMRSSLGLETSGEGQAHTILGWRGLTASPRLSRAPRRRHDPGVERFDGEPAIIASSQMVTKRETGDRRTTDPLGARLRKDTVFSNGKVHRLGL